MTRIWPTPHWPEDVPHGIEGYERPLFDILDDTAKAFPQQTFTIFQDATRTYAQVKEAADKVASFLASRGIEKGDRVAVFLPNIPQYPAIYFGILKAGGVCVTCNPMYTASELRFQLQDAGAGAVFCMDHPQFYPTAVKAIEGTKVHTLVYCGVKSQLPWLKGFLGGLLGKIPRAERHDPAHVSYDDLQALHRAEPPAVEIDPTGDLALIIYTGGTTGAPKGAALTHAAIFSNMIMADRWIHFPHEDGGDEEAIRRGYHTFLGVLPWYHSFGMTLCMLVCTYSASRLVCVPDPRAGDPPFTGVLQATEKYRCTLILGVPTIYVAYTNHPHLEQYDLSSVLACGSGGAPMPVEVAHQFEEKTGAVIFEGYGLSETSPLATLNPTNTRQRKFGSVGFPLPGTWVKILDAENGTEELPRGEDGEIAIHGPQVMQGYWERPDENERIFRDLDDGRYFLTGDIGHVDEEGYIVITDRKKDMILVGGFNVYPREVEEKLFQHPKVQLVAVVGVPHARSGEKVKAFVQLKEGESATEEEILAWCKEHMAGYKRPREVEFRDSLPTSNVGKVLRRVLRDEAREKAKQA